MKKSNCIVLLATLLVMVLLSVLPAGIAVADQKGTVFGGWLILRAAPSFNGAILASYPSGTVVSITGSTGSWYSVRTSDGLTGYMNSAYLRVDGGGSGGGGSPSSGTAAYITSANGLNVRVRSGPGKGYTILAAYAPGTPCTILTAGQNWCRVQVGSLTGYIMSQFLSTSPVIPPQPQPIPKPQPAKDQEYYVTSRNGQGVNMRSGPSKAYPSIGFYSVGTKVSMITPGNTWSYISIGDRYGYMMSQFLTDTARIAPEPVVGGAYVVSANGRNVNLRSAPTTAGKVIKSFKVGTRLNIITRGRDWYFIQIGGYYGYMMRQFIYDGGNPATFTDLH